MCFTINVKSLKLLVNNERLVKCLKNFSELDRVYWFDETNVILNSWFISNVNKKNDICDMEGYATLYKIDKNCSVIDFSESGFTYLALIVKDLQKFKDDHMITLK